MPDSDFDDPEVPDVKPIQKDRGIQHASDDEEQGDEEDEEEGVPKLPIGIRKTIIQYAPDEHTALPQSNDEVYIHYTAKLVDGTKVGSSHDPASNGEEKSDGEPFTFVIDQRPLEIVYGMELAVQTMKKGEIATFTLAPRFAYDELGVPGKIAPDATIIFDIELLDWVTRVDIFGDGRAVKTVLEAGTSKLRPGDSSLKEVRLTYTAADKKGMPLQDHQYADMDHIIGEPDFAPVSRLVDEALKTMVEGEHSKVDLSYDCVPSDRRFRGACLDLSLHRVFCVEDVSLRQDESLMKKELSKGDGPAVHAAMTKVTLRVDSATDGSAPIPGFISIPRIEFIIGVGAVCDPLEAAARRMRKGEEAELRCLAPKQCHEPQLGLDMNSTKCRKVIFILTLLSVDAPAKKDEELTPQERLEAATNRKTLGGEMFKQQRYAMAHERYKEVVQMLSGNAANEQELRLVCELNQAACLLKLEDNSAAEALCSAVLEKRPDNIKALYRRASANFGLSNYEAAVKDLQKLMALDKSSNEARALLAQVREKQREYSENAKSTAARMFPGRKGAEQPASTAEKKEDTWIKRAYDSLVSSVWGDSQGLQQEGSDSTIMRSDKRNLPQSVLRAGGMPMPPELGMVMHRLNDSHQRRSSGEAQSESPCGSFIKKLCERDHSSNGNT